MLILLLLALFVRSLIPLGYMPDTKNGSLITICSGLTTKTIFVADNTNSADHKQDAPEPCPFAPPILAGNNAHFAVEDFISIAYAKFHPDNNAPISHALIPVKIFLSQGPPLIA
ncbi:MAG: hypothetical protein DI586_00890 [Micavibrio aeruginosavorus]|uniref:DUF2946 domain-containing protein n=1 Tax=Micavibrio aeruginosavorus TaxID=349221 RepID=A0A2W5FTW3_9BACT|nr:MAG: hypothetical protein DI586_00890 [Micavibrio aeruginosavorus]